MDFNKLTLKSQEAVAAAQELARRMGNPELYPEHLLLALLDQELPQQLVPDSAALRAQAEAALTKTSLLRSAIAERARPESALSPSSHHRSACVSRSNRTATCTKHQVPPAAGDRRIQAQW